eukprot:15468015-Alexandrium_andersonii.AAC.1
MVISSHLPLARKAGREAMRSRGYGRKSKASWVWRAVARVRPQRHYGWAPQTKTRPRQGSP